MMSHSDSDIITIDEEGPPTERRSRMKMQEQLHESEVGAVGTTCGPQFTTCLKTPRNLSPGGSHPKCEAPPMDPGYQN